MTSFVPVPPIPAQPLRSNLISAARTPPADDPAIWQRFGVTYQPVQHGDFDVDASFGIFDPCSPGSIDITDAPGLVDWSAIGLWVASKCSGIGGGDVFAEAAARARQRLTNQESHLLERALWTGGGLAANLPLAAGDGVVTKPNGDTPIGLVAGLSLLIDTLADVVGGERAFIHVPARLGPYLGFYGAATVAANGTSIFTTINDHVIVLGTGYTGTGPGDAGEAGDQPPADNSMWIYATTAVEVRLGPVTVTEDPADMMDRSINDVVAIAQRPALAHFDEQAHIGVQICLPDPGPECTTAS